MEPLGCREGQIGQGSELATRVAHDPTDQEGEAQKTETRYSPEPELIDADEWNDPQGYQAGNDPHQTAEEQRRQLCQILLIHLLSSYEANVEVVSLSLGWYTSIVGEVKK